jgi:phospholipase C
VNGLDSVLLTANPNFINAANDIGATNPFRLDRSQALTVRQEYDYDPERRAFDFGLMDAFPEFTGRAGLPPGPPPEAVDTTGLVMGYYGGNTVTALWSYAQTYTLNDDSYGTNFGPSTVGALNLISGQTNGVSDTENGPSNNAIDDGNGGLTVIGDPDPIGDICSTSTAD